MHRAGLSPRSPTRNHHHRLRLIHRSVSHSRPSLSLSLSGYIIISSSWHIGCIGYIDIYMFRSEFSGGAGYCGCLYRQIRGYSARSCATVNMSRVFLITLVTLIALMIISVYMYLQGCSRCRGWKDFNPKR